MITSSVETYINMSMYFYFINIFSACERCGSSLDLNLHNQTIRKMNTTRSIIHYKKCVYLPMDFFGYTSNFLSYKLVKVKKTAIIDLNNCQKDSIQRKQIYHFKFKFNNRYKFYV